MGRRKRNKNKTIFLAAGMALLLFMTLLSFLLIRAYRNVKISRLSRLTFVITDCNDQVSVFSFEDKEGIILKLPVKERIILTHGFGEYELDKVFDLGELEKKGGLLLTESLENWLSIPIFGYFIEEKIDLNQYDKSPKSFLTTIFWRGFTGKNKTNLSKLELFLLYLKAKRLGNFQIKIKSGRSSFKDVFEDKRLREESISIEVLNATDHSGLAQKTANYLERAGGRVVRITDNKMKENKCKLSFIFSLKQSYTLFWLKTVYANCRFEQKEFVSDSDRAGITLSLGEDEWKKLNEKW